MELFIVIYVIVWILLLLFLLYMYFTEEITFCRDNWKILLLCIAFTPIIMLGLFLYVCVTSIMDKKENEDAKNKEENEKINKKLAVENFKKCHASLVDTAVIEQIGRRLVNIKSTTNRTFVDLQMITVCGRIPTDGDKILYVLDKIQLPEDHSLQLEYKDGGIGGRTYINVKEPNGNLSTKFLDYMTVDDSALGALQVFLLSKLWHYLPMYWHACYDKRFCVLSKDDLSKIENTINDLNADFQKFVDDRYFSLSNTSHVKKPKMVNKVLPYLAYKHDRTDKIALIVVDGMTYWQYLILHRELEEAGLAPRKDCTFAWMPTITKLSRQAIFKGEIPNHNYVQSPSHENELWTEFWMNYYDNSKRMNKHEIVYTHGSIQLSDICPLRQAFVDVTLDDVMHHLPSNKDLFDVTENWAKDAAKSIQELHKQGFTVYITTDHGNVYSHGWRNLLPEEKTFLYKNESRGKRHLMYQDDQAMFNFVDLNIDICKDLLVHDKWIVWRTAKCFSNQDIITHGGAHFLEVVIPFITIDK